MIRAAIIGLGVQGRKYARMLCNKEVKGMSLAGVCIRSDNTKKWAEENLKGISIYKGEEEMFSHSDDFDTLIITTPHKAHYKTTLTAFEKGKDVFCEKPLSTDVAQAEEMIRASKGHVFAVMFHLRAVGIYKWIKSKLDSGELGEIKRAMLESNVYFRTRHYHNSSSWRSTIVGEGGGALINQGQHLLDLWQWFFGMPDSLYADIQTGKYNDFDVEDEATLFMKYPRMTGIFFISTGEPFGSNRLEIIGTKGRITLEDEKITYIRYEDSQEYINTSDVNTGEKLKYTEEAVVMKKEGDPYVTMLENYVEHIEKGVPLIAEGSSGINALKLCSQAYKYR